MRTKRQRIERITEECFNYCISLMQGYCGTVSDKHYRFIPLQPFDFYEAMKCVDKIYKKKNPNKIPKFLEIGSAFGMNLHLAKRFFNWEVTGIEINPKSVAFYKKCVKHGDRLHFWHTDIEVILADALKYNSYRKYDIIYAYTPHVDYQLNRQMWSRIDSQIKSGTILLPFDGHNLHQMEYTQISDKHPIWVKR